MWHWREKKQGLFEDYVKEFMKMKQEKSGWPAHCKTREERQAYIDDYQRRQGIGLEYNAVKYNLGNSEVANRALNSLWGKFAQNPNNEHWTKS